MKLKKSKLKLSLLVLAISSMMCVPALAYTVYGQERFFQSEMPYSYINAYFSSRTKVSNEEYGYVRATYLSEKCDGLNVWFCYGGTTTRCSYIVPCNNIDVKYGVRYFANYSPGSSVRLGLEDLDNTQLFHHTVKGYVNYN